MMLCSLAWLLCRTVHPFIQGDVLQDFLPVFQILCEPSNSHANEVILERKGKCKPRICVNLVQDFFFPMKRFHCNLSASELAKDGSG